MVLQKHINFSDDFYLYEKNKLIKYIVREQA